MIKKLPDYNRLVRDVADEVFNRVKSRTPRDTGQAQEGWSVTHNGDYSVVSNEVPYIQRLEEGSSEQAPQGFVRITLEETDQIIQEALKKQI